MLKKRIVNGSIDYFFTFEYFNYSFISQECVDKMDEIGWNIEKSRGESFQTIEARRTCYMTLYKFVYKLQIASKHFTDLTILKTISAQVNLDN